MTKTRLADENQRVRPATERPVYLDYQATTPTDPRVVEAMLPWFTETFGNPHSHNHSIGWRAEEAVEAARRQIADLIAADPREIVFTSGATESNNLALKGLARFYRERGDHIITCVTEHKSVLETCADLEREGFRITRLPVAADGLLDPAAVAEAINERTLAVSVMAANNEIGVLQPLAEIGRICRKKDVFFHTDAAQAVGKVPVSVRETRADLLSLSGHKIYAPMGIGALYVRRRPRARIAPIFSGGGQERGMRSGTLPTPLCVGLGLACALSAEERGGEAERLSRLSRRFLDALDRREVAYRLNGHPGKRLPGNLNLSFVGVGGEGLMASLPDLAVASGSACSSAALEPSYVLRAIGVGDDLTHNSLRVGFGRFTTEAEVDYATARIAEEIERLTGGD